VHAHIARVALRFLDQLTAIAAGLGGENRVEKCIETFTESTLVSAGDPVLCGVERVEREWLRRLEQGTGALRAPRLRRFTGAASRRAPYVL
jgi:hypothetical protein